MGMRDKWAFPEASLLRGNEFPRCGRCGYKKYPGRMKFFCHARREFLRLCLLRGNEFPRYGRCGYKNHLGRMRFFCHARREFLRPSLKKSKRCTVCFSLLPGPCLRGLVPSLLWLRQKKLNQMLLPASQIILIPL